MIDARLFLCVLIAALPLSLAKPQENSLLEKGIEALERGEPDTAVSTFRAELDKRRAAGMPALALFTVQIALVRAYMECGDLYHAEKVLLEAQSELERFKGETAGSLAAAEVANNWGLIHLRRFRYKTARAELTAALEEGRKNPDAQELIPSLLNNLAASEAHLGKYQDALAHQSEALERWQAIVPEGQPCLIKARATLATIQYLAKDYPAAQRSIDSAITSARRAFGSKSPILADLLESDVVILQSLRMKREAKAAELEARRIARPKTSAVPSVSLFEVRTAALPESVRVVSK